MSKIIKIGIVGGGAIGSKTAEYCKTELKEKMCVTGIYDVDKKRSTENSLERLIKSSSLILEAVSVSEAPQIFEKVVRAGKDIIVMSVGGIVDRPDLLDLARKKACRVYFPSGAISGLDGIKAAALKKIDSVLLTTRKPKEGLRGALYIKEKGMDIDSFEKETVIFEGSALEAIKAFPKNVNVSSALSLAGIGAKKTKVRIICDPGIKRNIHEIKVEGDSGKIFIRMENFPSPDNPKTSYQAALSAMAVIKGIADNVKIGT